MKGTKRQVEWAVEIRDELLDQLDEARDKAGDAPTPEDYTSTWDDIERAIRTCDDARILIDKRGWYLNFAQSTDEDAIEATVAELTANFRPLRGTEKQIEWAERIRAGLIHDMATAMFRPTDHQKLFLPKDLPGYAREVSFIDNARWLIDNAKDGFWSMPSKRQPLPYLTPEQEALVAPLLGSPNAVLAAEAIRAKLINTMLAHDDGDDDDNQAVLSQLRACNDAAWLARETGVRLPKDFYYVHIVRATFPQCVAHRIDVERDGTRFKLAAGPYARCHLAVNFDRIISEGDGWIDFAAPEHVSVSEDGRRWASVPVSDVLSGDDTKLAPPVWDDRRDWQQVYVPTADVEEYAPGKSKVTLRCSRAEGLYFIVSNRCIDTTRIEGTLALTFHKDRPVTLYGAAEKKSASARWLFDDRTNPTAEPGESLAVEWMTLPVHSSRISTVGKGKVSALDFPDDHDLYPGWTVYHPAKLAQDGELRAHEEWNWRIVPTTGDAVEVSTAEMTELLSPWATTPKVKGRVLSDGKVTTTEPVRLAELERVGVLDDLADDL